MWKGFPGPLARSLGEGLSGVRDVCAARFLLRRTFVFGASGHVAEECSGRPARRTTSLEWGVGWRDLGRRFADTKAELSARIYDGFEVTRSAIWAEKGLAPKCRILAMLRALGRAQVDPCWGLRRLASRKDPGVLRLRSG